jgi:hypothetical protein
VFLFTGVQLFLVRGHVFVNISKSFILLILPLQSQIRTYALHGPTAL